MTFFRLEKYDIGFFAQYVNNFLLIGRDELQVLLIEKHDNDFFLHELRILLIEKVSDT